MLAPTLFRCTENAEQLARRMTAGCSFPFRLRLTCLRPCGSLLDGDGTVSAAAIEWQSDAAALGASSTFGANVVQVMTA
jgi:hypothetical protein